MFTLGDPAIVLQGSPTGLLTSGHTYSLFYNWSISEEQDGSGPIGTIGTPTSALGGFELSLKRSMAVPEPSALSLMFLGLAGIGYSRYCSKIAA